MIPHMWRRLMKYTTVNVLTRSVVALFIPLRLQTIAARRWMNRSCKMWFLCDGIFFWCCVKLSVVYSVQSWKNKRSDLPTWKRRYSLPKLPFKMMCFDVMFFSSTQTHWVHWEHQKVKGFFTNSSRKNSPFSLHNMGSWETAQYWVENLVSFCVTSRTGMTSSFEAMPGTAFASHMLWKKWHSSMVCYCL